MHSVACARAAADPWRRNGSGGGAKSFLRVSTVVLFHTTATSSKTKTPPNMTWCCPFRPFVVYLGCNLIALVGISFMLPCSAYAMTADARGLVPPLHTTPGQSILRDAIAHMQRSGPLHIRTSMSRMLRSHSPRLLPRVDMYTDINGTLEFVCLQTAAMRLPVASTHSIMWRSLAGSVMAVTPFLGVEPRQTSQSSHRPLLRLGILQHDDAGGLNLGLALVERLAADFPHDDVEPRWGPSAC